MPATSVTRPPPHARHPGFEREQDRARDPGVAVDPAGDDGYLLGLQCVLRERAAQRIEQELECVGRFTAHDHELRVEDADEVRGAEPQHVAGVVEHRRAPSCPSRAARTTSSRLGVRRRDGTPASRAASAMAGADVYISRQP